MHINLNKLIRLLVCYYPHKIPLGNNHYLCKGEFNTLLNLVEVENCLNNLTYKKYNKYRGI